jgi:TonB-linked SusC/RagA family outer membrane protein
MMNLINKYIGITVVMCLLPLTALAQLKTDSIPTSASVTTISVNDLERSSELDIMKSLYGKVAGLDVSQGAGMSAWNYAGLRLQGLAPLILVDGFPRSAATLTMTEIESIDVITDAASAAMYGVRGGNGVINIRTKKAVAGPMQISVGYRFGLNTKYRMPEFADAATYAKNLNTAYRLDGFANDRYSANEIAAFQNGNFPFSYPDVDWQREVYGDAGTNHQLDILVNGGNERFRYLTAVVYSYDQAMLTHNHDDPRYSTKPFDTRLNVRTNIEVDITESTLFNANLLGKLQEVNSTMYPNDLYRAVYNTPSAAFPIKTKEGIFGGNNIYGANNPVALAGSKGYNKDIYSTLLADMRLKQDLSFFAKGLYAEAAIAFDNQGVLNEQGGKSYRYQDFNPTMHDDGTVTYNPVTYGTDSEILVHESGLTSVYLNVDFRSQLGYNRTFGRHDLGVNLIYDQQASIANGRNNSMKRQSLISSVSWAYQNKYILNGVLSYSGSAVLPKNDRFMTYPALSAAWIASNEDFMKSSFLSFLKLRASYGWSGWDGNTPHDLDMQNYIWSEGYYFGDNVSQAGGQREGELAVENLTIEKSKKANAGIDLGLFDSRLNFSADLFYNRRSNILVHSSNAISQVVGIGVGQLNAGITDYKGIDLSAAWNHNAGDFKYGLSGTFSFVRSKIIKNNEAFQQYNYLYQKGNSASQVYGLECIGFFNSQEEINNSPKQTFSVVRPGDIRYKDQNGDNIIDSNDFVKMYRTSIPEIFYGFSLQLQWKNIGFTADFQGVANKTVSLLQSPLYKPLVNNGNLSKTFLERETTWTPENTKNVTMPRLTSQDNNNNYANSSLWYRDGSFLKLRNVDLYYNLPHSPIQSADIQIYLRGANLFSIDNIKFADPEQLEINYPSLRSYWAGLKVQF